MRLVVLNVGTSDNAIVIDLGGNGIHESAQDPYGELSVIPGGLVGDAAFLQECSELLPRDLVPIIEKLLSEVRRDFPGELREGLARKWVNHPLNFMALRIQNRDQSFAVYVKGQPEDFLAPTLRIKPDWGKTYSRFKLTKEDQLSDAIKVILQSAQNSEK
jgi:hypothetical protein